MAKGYNNINHDANCYLIMINRCSSIALLVVKLNLTLFLQLPQF